VFEYDPSKLVVSWARRLAEYKQPRVIFKDINRLKNILEDPKKPIQLLFAGNSHSADPNAKSIIEEIINIFSNQLSGSAIFIPNYNISLANHLVSGSDVWLNTPKGNREACGTSGMKAASNGVLNCTVLDGWTYEADWEGVGWVLDPKNVSSSFYEALETQIVPLYYNRSENGLPVAWINRMRKSIELSEQFSSDRMFEEYIDKLYKS
jgi:alpha-glucan phosphorylase-like protein